MSDETAHPTHVDRSDHSTLGTYEALVGLLSPQTRQGIIAASTGAPAGSPSRTVLAAGRTERTPAHLDAARRVRWFGEQVENVARVLDGTLELAPGVNEIDIEAQCYTMLKGWLSGFTRFARDPETDDFGFRFFVIDAIDFVAKHDLTELLRQHRPADPDAAARFDQHVAPRFRAAPRVRRLLNVHQATAASLDDGALEEAVRAWAVPPGHPRKPAHGVPKRLEKWSAIGTLLQDAPGQFSGAAGHKKYWNRQVVHTRKLCPPALRNFVTLWHEAELLSFLMFANETGVVPVSDVAHEMGAIRELASVPARTAIVSRRINALEKKTPIPDRHVPAAPKKVTKPTVGRGVGTMPGRFASDVCRKLASS